MKLNIKNMVCLRCKMLVKEELSKLGLHYTSVDLGEAEVLEIPSTAQLDQLRVALLKSGLELMDDKKTVLIQKIKNVIVELIHYSEEQLVINLSGFLSNQLNCDYTYLSKVFSDVQGFTIERFFITNKIERVKELLIYGELNLTEIAYRMHYSSVAHLSTQFKKVTGFTPSHFKRLKEKRVPITENR